MKKKGILTLALLLALTCLASACAEEAPSTDWMMFASRTEPYYSDAAAAYTFPVYAGAFGTSPLVLTRYPASTGDAYMFAGWLRTEDGIVYGGPDGAGNPKLPNALDGNYTLVAQWAPLKTLLHFNPNGGSPASPNILDDVEGYTFTQVSTPGPLSVSRPGRVLDGWSLSVQLHKLLGFR